MGELGIKLLDWLLIILAAMVGFIVRGHERRLSKTEEAIDELERRLPSEFERSELTRQRVRNETNVERIFETLDEMKERATQRHLELLEKIDGKADKA